MIDKNSTNLLMMSDIKVNNFIKHDQKIIDKINENTYENYQYNNINNVLYPENLSDSPDLIYDKKHDLFDKINQNEQMVYKEIDQHKIIKVESIFTSGINSCVLKRTNKNGSNNMLIDNNL